MPIITKELMTTKNKIAQATIKIQDEIIIPSMLNVDDVKLIMDKIPKDILKHLQKFLLKNKRGN